MIPGELFIQDGEIELNAGRKTVTLSVANTGDRPIQVGSHYHFFETNPALKFDRKKARGMRLDIAAGTAVRFEPGDTRAVDLVALGGLRTVAGLNQVPAEVREPPCRLRGFRLSSMPRRPLRSAGLCAFDASMGDDRIRTGPRKSAAARAPSIMHVERVVR